MKLNLKISSERNNYVYLILASEFSELNDYVIKYGKTRHVLTRFTPYGKNSILLFLCRVKDCHSVEDEIAKIFKIYFQQQPHGREYFKGDIKTMIDYINQIIDHMGQRMEDDMLDKIKETYRDYLKFNLDNVENLPDMNLNVLVQKPVGESNELILSDTQEKLNSKEDNNDYILDDNISFECDNCDKIFKTKKNLNYHEVNKVCIDKNHVCEHCGNTFTSIVSMRRHIKESCKVKNHNEEKNIQGGKQDNVSKDKKYEEVKRENKILKLEIENKLMAKQLKEMDFNPVDNPIVEPKIPKVIISKNTSNNEQKKKTIISLNNKIVNDNTANNATNNACIINNYNVNLVANGQEDMGKIDMKTIIKGISGFHTPISLTEEVNFNDKYPENHNVFISNIKEGYANVFDGRAWNLVSRTELIDRIYERQRDYIEENIEELAKSLSQNEINALRQWLEINSNHAKIKEIKKKLKLLLYNKRKIPMDTKKKIEQNNKNNSQNVIVQIDDTNNDAIDHCD